MLGQERSPWGQGLKIAARHTGFSSWVTSPAWLIIPTPLRFVQLHTTGLVPPII